MENINTQPNERFQEQYDLLNPEQQKAVNTIYGPVLVIAGPGTGKTQILSLRIAKLLQSEVQVQAHNILCLTFTDEGKKNMRDRLYKLLGPEAAQHISVHTFHSFCNEIIQQNLSYFQKDTLDQISELEEIQIIKEVLSSLPSQHPLYNPKYPLSNASFLKSLFAKMKQENWSEEYLMQKSTEAIEGLTEITEYVYKKGERKGALTQKGIKQKESLERLMSGVSLFNTYQNLMLDRHRYDYNDMIQWVIRMLSEQEDVLLSYQERFQYLLVDEFQDTNGSQLELVNLLSSYDESPNTFVVGDDDQSIFRFQGASVENMNRFKEKYEKHGLTEICLKTNYRSYQGILDKAANLIQLNANRLVNTNPLLDKDLISYSTSTSKNDFTPQLMEFHNPRYEKVYIATQIKSLIDKGVKPNEIAVLYFDNASCLELGNYLQVLGIEYYSKKQLNLLDDVFAKQLIKILKYIVLELDNPYSGDELLFDIMHFNFWRIPALEIAKASILAYQYSSEHRKTKTSFRLYLQEQLEQTNPSLFNLSAQESLLHAARSIEALIKDAENKSLIQMLDAVVERCGIVRFMNDSEQKFELLEILRALFELVKDEAHRDPGLSLSEFIKLLDLMAENDIGVARTKLYGNDAAVRLFTVHASKGREFEYVFLAGCVAKSWEGRKGNSANFTLPGNVLQTAISSKDHEELRRMLYVALTRAKKELYVSYYNFDLNDKDTERSKFVYEIFGTEARALKPSITKGELFQFESLLKEDDTTIAIQQLEKEYVNRQLANFEMNVSALNNYLDCPLHFYFNNILRMPSGVSETMTFGSAVHHGLEHFFRDMKSNNSEFPSQARLQEHFEWYMRRNREKFSKEGYTRLMTYGKEILTMQYEKNINTWNKQVVLEEYVRAVVNGIPLKGMMDKIESTEAGEVVVDYKTGDASSDRTKAKFKKPDHENELSGGDYWRQAVFYKLLLDHQHPRKYKTIGVKYEFVEPEKKSKQIPEPIYIDITHEDMATLQHQITTVWEKIQNHDFYTGCGERDCSYCNFVKDSNQVIPVIEEE